MKLFLLLLVLIRPVFATELHIKLTADQIEKLGIVEGKLSAVSNIPILVAPANVLIPPNHEYVVNATQTGIINQLHAAVGEEIKKGDILAQIDSPNLLSLQSNYLKAASLLQLATAAYQRDKKLAQEGIIAERRVQETESKFKGTEIDVQEAKRLLEISGGTVGKALSSHLTLSSPISGVVLERMVVTGARIDNLTPLYRVADLQTLWLEIAIPQERILDVKVGDHVNIENPPLTADISLIGQNVNAENQTVLARAVLKNASKQLRVGQKLSVQLYKTSQQKIFSILNTGIAKQDGQSFIFVKNANGFEVKPITQLGKQEEKTVISGELSGEETVALKGAGVLKANWLGLGSVDE